MQALTPFRSQGNRAGITLSQMHLMLSPKSNDQYHTGVTMNIDASGEPRSHSHFPRRESLINGLRYTGR
jgi:hypothetical protein